MDSEMTIVYKKSEPHQINLLSQLKANGEFCDVTITCGQVEVMAHKCVLAASTEYFRGMFSNDTYEANTGTIDFSSAMTPEVLSQCVDFIYLGSVGISKLLARGLLDAAEMLQMPKLSELCVEFLAENIDLTTFAEVINLSRLYNKDALNGPILTFLDANLYALVKSTRINLLDYEMMDYCFDLMRGSFRSSEIIKWAGLVVWTNANVEERITQFHDLFLKIDLQRIPREIVKKRICTVNLIDGSLKCLQHIRNYFAGKLPPSENRIPPMSHITSINKATKVVYQYDLCNETWEKAGELPSTVGRHCQAVEYHGILYVGDSVSLHAFNGTEWRCVMTMGEDDGSDDDGSDDEDESDDEDGGRDKSQYNQIICTGKWVIMVSIRSTMMFDIASVERHRVDYEDMRHSDGFFIASDKKSAYVLGGQKGHTDADESNSVSRLILQEKEYSQSPSMIKGRAYGAAIWYKEFLYALGGVTCTVEFLNEQTRQWQILSNLEIQCRNVKVHLSDKLYIFGGVLGTDVKTVELRELEIPANEAQPTKRSAGNMEACCASYAKYIKLSN